MQAPTLLQSPSHTHQHQARHSTHMVAADTVAGSNIDLVPLLYEPAQFEAKLTDGHSTSAPSSQAPSILDALHSLNRQCHVFKKSAEQLGWLLLPAPIKPCHLLC